MSCLVTCECEWIKQIPIPGLHILYRGTQHGYGSSSWTAYLLANAYSTRNALRPHCQKASATRVSTSGGFSCTPTSKGGFGSGHCSWALASSISSSALSPFSSGPGATLKGLRYRSGGTL